MLRFQLTDPLPDGPRCTPLLQGAANPLESCCDFCCNLFGLGCLLPWQRCSVWAETSRFETGTFAVSAGLANPALVLGLSITLRIAGNTTRREGGVEQAPRMATKACQKLPTSFGRPGRRGRPTTIREAPRRLNWRGPALSGTTGCLTARNAIFLARTNSIGGSGGIGQGI